MTDSKYYWMRSGKGLCELRQTRFIRELARGREHPHDVCAVARTTDDIVSMSALMKHIPSERELALPNTPT